MNLVVIVFSFLVKHSTIVIHLYVFNMIVSGDYGS